MLRVKDHEASLKFYQEIMGILPLNESDSVDFANISAGMKLMRTSENASAGFNLYFLGYDSPPTNTATANGVNPTAHREGLLELTWNYGTEKDETFKYHNGNDEPQGFGHIAISVDDLNEACKRFEEKGVNWKKRLTDGRMKNVAFVLDPDAYWIEVRLSDRFSKHLTDITIGDPE